MAKTKLLIEDTEHEYEISEEDLLLYAQQIGINTNTEEYLMWIARKGLSAKVPKPWMIFADKKNRVFYYNTETCEKSWNHPLDKEYASLVSEERTKSKSLHSASSDYEFESKPLEPVNDSSVSSGRFPKASLQQLSSLADAPPLSSSGKNTPPSSKLQKPDTRLSGKKIEFGRIENRRGVQLAPVRLNSLKMHVPSVQQSSGGMSFMPKGATLSKNVKRVKQTVYSDHFQEEKHGFVSPHDDSNESLNSDEESKYSYEESDDEDKHIHPLEPYDLLDTSQLSPMHSADESPDAVDINSLVQLGTKLEPRFDNSRKSTQLENSINKENSPSLSLRKIGRQPSILKPLTQSPKKKGSFKKLKPSKQNKHLSEYETDFEDKVSAMNNEQKLMMEQVQKEWMRMQDEVKNQEKEKYEEMKKDISKKFEEEEKILRSENSEKILKIKNELQKNIANEESAAEERLLAIKASNQAKMKEEEEKLQKERETLSESLKIEIKKIKDKIAEELLQNEKKIEETSKLELEKLQLIHDSNKKSIEEAHLVEISKLQESHKQKISEIETDLERKRNETKNKVLNDIESPKKLQEEHQNFNKLIEKENENYKNLLSKKENLLQEIESQKSNLDKTKKEKDETQMLMQEIQDDVDKTENDLDLLRAEKSALISELTILKENIKNEKSNLLNLENKMKSEAMANSSKKCNEAGVNTYFTSINSFNKASQVSVSSKEAYCQIENIYFLSEASCQTSVFQVNDDKSCQVDFIPYCKEIRDIKDHIGDKSSQQIDIDKTFEKALNGLGNKMDLRISIIENQLKLLQESLTKSNEQPECSNQESILQFSESIPAPIIDNKNFPSNPPNDDSLPISYISNNIPSSSHNKCKCELGDATSCDVLQDMRSSIYHLNNILSHNFVPPSRGQTLCQVNQPTVNYSSSFESFYTQFRQMQEKHRLMELKHKCENETMKLTKSSLSYTTDEINAGKVTEKELTKPTYNFGQLNSYSLNIPDDPLIRARNLVLKEQARAWKQQQSSKAFMSQILSSNNSSDREKSHPSLVGLNTAFSNMSHHSSFINFDIDPEADYNNWMTRLNALQLRIRSHKMP